jgi:glucose-1-phosphate thymidylyltransferase
MTEQKISHLTHILIANLWIGTFLKELECCYINTKYKKSNRLHPYSITIYLCYNLDVFKVSKMKITKREIKGIILAGGKATRLHPLTLTTNKHLLLIGNKPVVYYVIEKMIQAGINNIMIITSPHHVKDFIEIVGIGEHLKIPNKKRKKIKITYAIQKKPLGIAHGLLIAKDHVGKDNCLLCLGDNILEDNIAEYVKNFDSGALVFLKKVKNGKSFGVAQMDKKGNIMNIEEKPEKPKSNFAVIGAYLYDNTLFDKFNGIKKSLRGEYEITYINNKYIKEGSMKSVILNGKWFDIGTFENLKKADNYMKAKNENR